MINIYDLSSMWNQKKKIKLIDAEKRLVVAKDGW